MRSWRASSPDASRRTSASDAKSARSGSTARPPTDSIRWATRASLRASRPTGTIVPPRLASSTAAAAPIPELAPVTTKTGSSVSIGRAGGYS
jgi:hypothetical protein